MNRHDFTAVMMHILLETAQLDKGAFLLACGNKFHILTLCSHMNINPNQKNKNLNDEVLFACEFS